MDNKESGFHDSSEPDQTPNLSARSVSAKDTPRDSSIPPEPDATLVNVPISYVKSRLSAQTTSFDADATMVDIGPLPRSTGPGTNPPKAQTSPPALRPGDVLGGRYQILQLLGEGGMGAVYKAMDRELDRPVALKLIRPQLASNPSILARFKQELLLAHRVTHKNVFRIYDPGNTEGVKFITMEFVEGDDLRAILQEKKKFTPQDAVEIIQQVCL